MTRTTAAAMRAAPRCFRCGLDGVVAYRDLHDRLFGVEGSFSLRRCPECGLMWLDPRPQPGEERALYRRYYTHQRRPASPGRLRAAVKRAILSTAFGYAELEAPSWWRRALASLGPLTEAVGLSVRMLDGTRRGRLLDIGCGNGEFLVVMRDLGWDVCGVDIDVEAVDIARREAAVPALAGSVEAAHFPDRSFDAVTLSHVLEHLPDPGATLAECARILRPGGRLVVVTPNVASLGHRLFRASWLGLDVPRHFHLFTAPTLAASAQGAGLRVERSWTTARDARVMWMASLRLWRHGELPDAAVTDPGVALRLSGVVFQAVEQALAAGGLGEELVMIATPGGDRR